VDDGKGSSVAGAFQERSGLLAAGRQSKGGRWIFQYQQGDQMVRRSANAHSKKNAMMALASGASAGKHFHPARKDNFMPPELALDRMATECR
jgi:hypothetical protein